MNTTDARRAPLRRCVGQVNRQLQIRITVLVRDEYAGYHSDPCYVDHPFAATNSALEAQHLTWKGQLMKRLPKQSPFLRSTDLGW